MPTHEGGKRSQVFTWPFKYHDLVIFWLLMQEQPDKPSPTLENRFSIKNRYQRPLPTHLALAVNDGVGVLITLKVVVECGEPANRADRI